MKTITTDFKSAMLIGVISVLPFMILELVNRRNFPESFPVELFGLLWLLPMVFIIVLMPLVRDVRAHNVVANPIKLLLSVMALVIIAIMWGSILVDQIPCFIGVPNCD